jgi:hypothetical protein
MRLVPLPAIDDDPRDEEAPAFRDALINARLTDENYLLERRAENKRNVSLTLILKFLS